MTDLGKKISEGQLQLNDWDRANRKCISENSDLLRQLEELDSNISMLQKVKIQLSNQLEDAKRACEEESKERQSLMGRYRTLEHEYDGTNAVYEEEMAAKDHLERQCQKAEAEANLWRLKVSPSGVQAVL